jgi:hypothetical protein
MKFLKNACCIYDPWKKACILEIPYLGESLFKSFDFLSGSYSNWGLDARKVSELLNKFSLRYGISKIQALFMNSVYSMHFLKTSYLGQSLFKSSEFFSEGYSNWRLHMCKLSGPNLKVRVLQNLRSYRGFLKIDLLKIR